MIKLLDQIIQKTKSEFRLEHNNILCIVCYSYEIVDLYQDSFQVGSLYGHSSVRSGKGLDSEIVLDSVTISETIFTEEDFQNLISDFPDEYDDLGEHVFQIFPKIIMSVDWNHV